MAEEAVGVLQCVSVPITYFSSRYNEIFFMIDTCQANTMYSKIYSPNILATGSSQIHESSYSVRCIFSLLRWAPLAESSSSSLSCSMRTTTTSAWPLSTALPTTCWNSWKASTRPARNPCKTLLVPHPDMTHLYPFFKMKLFCSLARTILIRFTRTPVSEATFFVDRWTARSSLTFWGALHI